MTTIASQPSRIGTENRRMKRGIIGCAPTCVLLMRDFTKQKVWAFKPSVVLSSLTTPSTVMRQVMLSPSPCATMFGLAAGAVVVRVSDHGKVAFSAFWG